MSGKFTYHPRRTTPAREMKIEPTNKNKLQFFCYSGESINHVEIMLCCSQR